MKGMDHDSVLAQYHQELKELKSCNYLYSGKTNSSIPVVVQLLIIAADPPERCSINCILSHAGTTTQHWKYSSLIDPTKLQSCAKCRKRLLSKFEGNIHITHKPCQNCADWDYGRSNLLGILPPDSYPTNSHQDSPNPPTDHSARKEKIIPITLTYDILKQGCGYCFYNMYKG